MKNFTEAQEIAISAISVNASKACGLADECKNLATQLQDKLGSLESIIGDIILQKGVDDLERIHFASNNFACLAEINREIVDKVAEMTDKVATAVYDSKEDLDIAISDTQVYED